MTFTDVYRRLAKCVVLATLAGFLAFISVSIQSITQNWNAVEHCRELKAAGFQCVWSNEHLQGEYRGTRTNR